MRRAHRRCGSTGGEVSARSSWPDPIGATPSDYSAVMEVVAALHALDADDAVGAVLVYGEGRSFCAGGDLDEFRRGISSSAYDFHRGGDGWAELMTMIARAAQARGRGAARARPRRRVRHRRRGGHRHRRRGHGRSAPRRSPSGCSRSSSTRRWSRRSGARPAHELALTGRRVDAEEACRLGLVHRVVPADDHLAAAREPPTSWRRRDGTRWSSASGSCGRSTSSRSSGPPPSPSRSVARS